MWLGKELFELFWYQPSSFKLRLLDGLVVGSVAFGSAFSKSIGSNEGYFMSVSFRYLFSENMLRHSLIHELKHFVNLFMKTFTKDYFECIEKKIIII